MEPQQKANEIANDNKKSYWSEEECCSHYSYKECYKSALDMYEWTRKQLIDEACEFMRNYILEHDYVDIFEMEDEFRNNQTKQ